MVYHMDMYSKKQLEFFVNSKCKWNLAHGAVRTGKTVGTLFRFLHAANECPDSQIFMVGHTSETIYENAIRLIMESPQFAIFRPFCTWFTGKRHLKFKDKVIATIGAKDSGSIGQFQGKTMSLVYCDEMTLYPENIIDMIDTRLSMPHSMGFASMNPSHPSHKIKQWIDKADAGDPNYYALHFLLEDNPFVDESYKLRVKNSLSGLFYKRNYLGLWCLADGAIFDFFDPNLHVSDRPPAAEYYIAGVDFGVSNNFACVLMGVNTGINTQTGVKRWIEAEYVWDSKKRERSKTNTEYAEDIEAFLEPYGVKSIYLDPSAASFRVELQRRGMPVIDADNDVLPGITYMTSEMAKGAFKVHPRCKVLIKEIETYVWDHKASERGEDRPLKKDDHCIDAMRYALYTHKVAEYNPYKHNQDNDKWRNRFEPGPRRFG